MITRRQHGADVMSSSAGVRQWACAVAVRNAHGACAAHARTAVPQQIRLARWPRFCTLHIMNPALKPEPPDASRPRYADPFSSTTRDGVRDVIDVGLESGGSSSERREPPGTPLIKIQRPLRCATSGCRTDACAGG